MRDVLRAGADKVSLNTAAVPDPGLVERCAGRFGRQAAVVAIDARRTASVAHDGAGVGVRGDPSPSGGGDPISGPWEVLVRGGRDATGLDAVAWAVRAVALGAGELLVTSIDRDGTQTGFDTDLLRAVSSRVRVPVIASGGAAGPDDFVRAIVAGGADAVLAASIFHRALWSIEEVKAAMAEAGLPVRRVETGAAA
jgi:cyclase